MSCKNGEQLKSYKLYRIREEHDMGTLLRPPGRTFAAQVSSEKRPILHSPLFAVIASWLHVPFVKYVASDQVSALSNEVYATGEIKIRLSARANSKYSISMSIKSTPSIAGSSGMKIWMVS